MKYLLISLSLLAPFVYEAIPDRGWWARLQIERMLEEEERAIEEMLKEDEQRKR